MLLYTGARLSEVLRATWAEIPDFGDPVWHRPKDHMKAGKASSLPLSAETITLLRRQPRTRSPYIFPSQPFGGRRFDLKDTWYAVRKEADLPTLRLHDLRHVFASQMLESGVPLDAVGMLLAHSSQSAKHAITLRYAERSLDSLRQLSAAGATELARRE
jgi:integrase